MSAATVPATASDAAPPARTPLSDMAPLFPPSASLADLAAADSEAALLARLQKSSAPVRSALGKPPAGVTALPRSTGSMTSLSGAEHSGSPLPDVSGAPALPPAFESALGLLRQGGMALMDDSFTRCFKTQKRVPWNWNVYLWPAWLVGVALRYVVLFPLRVLCLMCGAMFFIFSILGAKTLGLVMDVKPLERWLIQMLASAFVVSWSSVIRIHGIRPTPRPGQPAGVFVANHSSMIDFLVLLQSHTYAVVGQMHPGWVGYTQKMVLGALHCIWFNRGEANDRKVVAERLRAHSHDVAKAPYPLLVFPEGTCVNNEYVVQFKKGVFELGVPINPIAIKYNKVFVDAFWNSREQTFGQHLIRLMTSWAVVCDVWFMDPQTIRPDETPEAFATRVQHMIAARAGLQPVEWDGYMKYWKPSERFIKARQQTVANGLLQKCHASAHEDTSSRTSSSTNLSEDMGGSVLSSSASGSTLRLRNNRLATLSDAGAHGSVAGSSVAPLSGSSASLSSNGTPTVDGLITGMGDGASYISSRHFHVDAHGRPMVLHGRQSLGGADSRPRVSVHEDELEAISSFPDSDAVAHGDDTAARKAERALRAQLQAADRQVNSLTRAAVARASIATARKLAALGATPAHGAMAGRAGAIPTLDADMGASSSQSVRTAAPAPVVAGVLPPASEATFEIADHSTP